MQNVYQAVGGFEEVEVGEVDVALGLHGLFLIALCGNLWIMLVFSVFARSTKKRIVR